MIKYRYFPFLGYKTLESDEKELLEIPEGLGCKALTFEWLGIYFVIVGKVYKEEKEDNGN